MIMKTKVPFTKDILFKSKIAEITSISLEHELSLEKGDISGVFIISGDYKTHEVCVNKEEFEYKLPFNVEVTENIDLDTLNFEILDFYYDIIGEDTLRVNIEFVVEAAEKNEEIETTVEEPQEEVRGEEMELVDFETIPQDVEEVPLEVSPNVVENDSETSEETSEERLNEEEKNTILNAISEKSDNEYITYNVHIVRQMETLESICETYNANIDLVKEYNNIETLNIGDKIIIPTEKDE